MKKIRLVIRAILLKTRLILQFTTFLLLAGTFGGCREIKYLMYYPHPVLGAIEPSAEWREFAVSPLTLEKYDFLAVSFTQDGRVPCMSGLSAFHLCSPAAKSEYNRLLEECRRIPIQTPESNDSKLKILQDKMRKTVESEPLPDLEIELVTESGEVEKYETRHYGFVEDHKLAFEFHDCNQSARDPDKLAAGESEESAEYSPQEKNFHHEICQKSHAKTFVKIRLRSAAGMKIEAIKIENNNSPFAIR